MSREQKEYIEGLRQEIRDLQAELATKKSAVYTKEFKELALFVVSIVLPLGWTELPLLSPASISQVRVGLVLWGIPIVIAAHLGWKLVSMKGNKILAWVPVALAVAIYAGIVLLAYRGFAERQFEEVKQGLHATVMTAPSAKLPDTVFTFTNDSAHGISSTMFCGIHKIVGDDGMKSIGNLSRPIVSCRSDWTKWRLAVRPMFSDFFGAYSGHKPYPMRRCRTMDGLFID